MFKWLFIIIIAFVGFSIAILGLGYLLKDNEEKTRNYLQKLPTEQSKDSKSHPIEVDVVAKELSINQQIISEHLTCVDSSQCTVTLAKFADLTCPVAVNTIGQVKLSQVNDKSTIGQCTYLPTTYEAICLRNVCQISLSP